MEHLAPNWVGPAGRSRRALVVITNRSHGDLSVHQPGSVLTARQRAIADAPWSWLHQVHGSRVWEVASPGDRAGAEGDALWTASLAAPIAVQIADCAPVALIGDNGTVAVAHAGWRGLVAGVIESTAGALRRRGAETVLAIAGPCITPAAYEFSEADLDVVADALGAGVRSVTADGRPALDMPAAVRLALARSEVDLADDLGDCTAANAGRWWSHRARGDTERQAMVAWLEEAP